MWQGIVELGPAEQCRYTFEDVTGVCVEADVRLTLIGDDQPFARTGFGSVTNDLTHFRRSRSVQLFQVVNDLWPCMRDMEDI